MFKYGIRLVRVNKSNTRWISYSRIIRNNTKLSSDEPLKKLNTTGQFKSQDKETSSGNGKQQGASRIKVDRSPLEDNDGNKENKENIINQPNDQDNLKTGHDKQEHASIKTGEITESLFNLDHQATIDDEETNEYLTTIFEKMEPYMDTYDVHKQLLLAGFTANQSNEIINLLIVQLNSKLSKLSTKYSQLFELENERYLFESAQQELRVDITRSRESHINELINLINILERDFNAISDELNNDFLQLKNNNEVTINDQKQENTLSSKKIMLKIQETNHKITTELNSEMRSEIESLRWHLSRWGVISILICIFSGCATFFVFKKNADQRERKEEFIPLVVYEPLEIDDDDYHTDIDEGDL